MSTVDPYDGAVPSPLGPYANMLEVSPSDTVPLEAEPCALYIGGAGDLVVIDVAGNTITFKAVPVGTVLPIRPVQVMETNTTATNIVAMW